MVVIDWTRVAAMAVLATAILTGHGSIALLLNVTLTAAIAVLVLLARSGSGSARSATDCCSRPWRRAASSGRS